MTQKTPGKVDVGIEYEEWSRRKLEIRILSAVALLGECHTILKE